MWPGFIALSTLLAASLRGAAPQTPDTAVDARPATDEFVVQSTLPRLRQMLRDGIEQKTPSTSIWQRSGKTTVFDGSYDFHSCIAAHWAGLCMARHADDAKLAQHLLARLPPSQLAAEHELIVGMGGKPADGAGTGAIHRQLQRYVDTWFLLLLSELLQHPREDQVAIATFRTATMARLLVSLEEGPFPEVGPDKRPPNGVFGGNYRSWLFALLSLRLGGADQGEPAERYRRLVDVRLQPQRAALLAQAERHPYDFLDVRSLHALLLGLDSPATAEDPANGAIAEFTPLPENVTLATVHPVGACASEAWPFAMAGLVNAAAKARHLEHTAAILRRTDLWADDFVVVSHWVPQFLWFGLWLASGERYLADGTATRAR
ncbi:MAG: hypothetical protein IPK26_21265 [Planctomycetes bacterium]|nr:hypothetical protein [Planctomycetota bacterium]